MDESDKTDLDIEVLTDAAKRKFSKLVKQQEQIKNLTGRCLYCGAIITDEKRRWCNSECRDEYELDLKREGRRK